MKSTFSVLFFIRRTKLLRTGEAPICMRITVDKKRAEVLIKRSIVPEQWNKGKGCAKGNTKSAQELNHYLETAKLKIYQIHRELEIDGEIVTADAIKDRYIGNSDCKKTILEVFREHNQKCNKLSGIDMAPGTVERYETSYKHTKDFIKLRYGKEDYYLREIDNSFVRDYEFYLKTERKCNHNTTVKYLKNFKKIILIALNNEWIKKDPFNNIKFRLNEVDALFLDNEELQSLIHKRFDIPRIDQVRDIFLFCCFTGLAFADVKAFKNEHIVKDLSGKLWIRKKRQKTKNMCNIPLLDIPSEILKKYKDDPECQIKGSLLPVPSNQKMNAYLKEIADLCGINKPLTTHCARHTFATTVTLANKVSMESVSKMLGHSSILMTKKYARILDATVGQEMGRVSNLYSNQGY